MTEGLLIAAAALLLLTGVEAYRVRGLRAAYVLVLAHARRDIIGHLQAMAKAEEEAITAELPEVEPGLLEYTRTREALQGPLHAPRGPADAVPLPPGTLALPHPFLMSNRPERGDGS